MEGEADMPRAPAPHQGDAHDPSLTDLYAILGCNSSTFLLAAPTEYCPLWSQVDRSA